MVKLEYQIDEIETPFEHKEPVLKWLPKNKEHLFEIQKHMIAISKELGSNITVLAKVKIMEEHYRRFESTEVNVIISPVDMTIEEEIFYSGEEYSNKSIIAIIDWED